MDYLTMKDGELRGLLLQALYVRRRERSDFHPETGAVDLRDGKTLLVEGIPYEEQRRILKQLQDAYLVGLQILRSNHAPLLAAWISTDGIDVVEGNRPAPIAITLHANNAQIGDGNTLSASPDRDRD